MLMSTRFLVGRLGLVFGTGLAGVSGATGIAIAGALVALVASWRIRRE
jgi:hypothetical protein